MSEGVPNVTPVPQKDSAERDPTLTVDTFIGEVPMDSDRCILVFRRQHAGREFIRWRVFHKHRKCRDWYPDKRRGFVIPVELGEVLGSTIAAAQRGETVTAKPEWLAEVDAWREHRYRLMAYLNAPTRVLNLERRRQARGYGL